MISSAKNSYTQLIRGKDGSLGDRVDSTGEVRLDLPHDPYNDLCQRRGDGGLGYNWWQFDGLWLRMGLRSRERSSMKNKKSLVMELEK